MFFPRLRKALLNKENIELIIDVGANKGQSIQFFLKNFPNARIIGFEPNEKLNKFLKKFESEKCKILNLGISNRSGDQIFYENMLDETSSFSKPEPSSKWGKLKQVLLISSAKNLTKETLKKVITLDEFCAKNNIMQIDYLKIDVEGYEFNVLIGAKNLLSQGRIINLQLENQANDLYNTDFDEITNLLVMHNYKKITEISHGFGSIYDVIFAKQ